MVSIMSANGSSAATYRITAAGDGNALAQQIGCDGQRGDNSADELWRCANRAVQLVGHTGQGL